MGFLKALFGDYSKRELKRIYPICDKVLALDDKYAKMSESELKAQTAILKERLKKCFHKITDHDTYNGICDRAGESFCDLFFAHKRQNIGQLQIDQRHGENDEYRSLRKSGQHRVIAFLLFIGH